MSAFFFGPPERQLFGYHHVPRGTPTGAAVLCPPWAREYQYAHRAFHFLAKRLAARGCHVLRFDYSGTGDSWGASTEANTERWAEDIALAVGELRTMSGLEHVDLVGLRVGAFLAAQATADIPGVRRIVLWDPIMEGEAWLRELGVAGAVDGGRLEVGGTIVSRTFVDQIRAIRPETYEAARIERVLFLLTQGDDEGDGFDSSPHLPGVERVWLQQPAPWLEDPSIWAGQVPVEAVKRIVEWLS